MAFAAGFGAAYGLTPPKHWAPLPLPAPATSPTSPTRPGPVVASNRAADQAAVGELCSKCHLLPPPDVVSRHQWPDIVDKMFQIAGAQGHSIGSVTAEMATRHYEASGPAHLPVRPRGARANPAPLRLTRRSLAVRGVFNPNASTVRLIDLDGVGRPDLVVTDMRTGRVMRAHPGDGNGPLQPIAQLTAPARVEPADLDGDGRLDLLVSDLGVYQPSDVMSGSVVWLRRQASGGWESIPIARGLGRVADARAADFDKDGDLDVVVAVFGFRAVGEVLYLENRAEGGAEPSFVPAVIDPRAGAIHVPVVDLNDDGNPDILALLSQHHEEVIAYLGDGRGGFEPRRLWRAPHPNWGHTGLEPVDLDADGDLDVLLTNGDTLDARAERLLPFHGIRWLENRGPEGFHMERIQPMYGAHRALPADLDGDGDLDIVAASFIPYADAEQERGVMRLPSLLWLERIAGPRPRFIPHVIETGLVDHASIDVADVDGDGDLDIAVGNFLMGNFNPNLLSPTAFVLINEGIAR